MVTRRLVSSQSGSLGEYTEPAVVVKTANSSFAKSESADDLKLWEHFDPETCPPLSLSLCQSSGVEVKLLVVAAPDHFKKAVESEQAPRHPLEPVSGSHLLPMSLWWAVGLHS